MGAFISPKVDKVGIEDRVNRITKRSISFTKSNKNKEDNTKFRI